MASWTPLGVSYTPRRRPSMSPPTTMLLRPTFTFTPPAALALALALSSAAAAQTTTFHDAAGRVTGKATTRNGATTFYDSAGRVTGKARTNAEGTTTFYDAAGHVTGKATAPRIHHEHHGDVVYRHACRLGSEGIVSKRLGSPYVSGRTRHWLKFKNPAAPAVKREAEEEWGKR